MNKKLYVGNLPFTAEDAQLLAVFGGDGRQVVSAKILIDKMTGRSRGFGFVEMATPEDAQKAIAALHGHDFMGRPLTVNEAREMPPREAGAGGGRPGFGRSGGGPRPSYGGGGGFDRGSNGGGGYDRGGGGGGGGYDRGGNTPPAEGNYGDRAGAGLREKGDRKRTRGGRDD
jgi:cold-inducible RNA-binding protein